ncbi:MAG: ATP-binding cassette domain-containing protein [Opitutaceae bacterium]|jgi:phospholipid/cholesterol/gamma-HCH transport system ATP-binding protein|nr:ATP-binding cassette domain-containing protein [Opitutaceae bacterium]
MNLAPAGNAAHPAPPASPSPPPPSPGAPPAIEARGLDCGYGDRPILKNITFTVAPGEIVFIGGASGCGKSTLLRHLVGLNPPQAGDVFFFGESFARADERHQRELLRTFGVLYQSGALWSSLTLRQNVSLPLEEYTRLDARERHALATWKLSQVGLTGYEDYYPSEISGGMKKRAGLARALALDPAIVFFDEPSAGLDPLTSRNLDDLIVNIRDTLGTTCVIISHELASIMSIGERILMLSRETQGIVADGDPRHLARESPAPRVREFLTRGKTERNF